MKFMLIEFWMEDNHPSTKVAPKKTVFESYEKLLKHLNDEHYALGVCGVFTVLASDEDGDFGNQEYQDILSKAISLSSSF